MAHLQDILIDAGNIIEQVLEKHREKEENLLQAYFAARTIQKYYRGHLVRKHIKMLHAKTTIIQKHWRGVLGRRVYFQLLKDTVQKRCTEKFNKCATKIQKVWRGFVVRKYIFDYNLFKKWMENVKISNKIIIDEIEKERQLLEESSKLEAEEDAKRKLQCVLIKTHHWLRTYHRKGVLSRKEDTREYSSAEEILRSFNFLSYMRKQKHDKAKKENMKPQEDRLTEYIDEFTLDKIKKLKRDCALRKAKEREESDKKNQLKSGKMIEKKILNIPSKKRTEECKCCTIPNYRQY